MLAVERRATKAVFGEAPEDLSFTVGDFDRAVNFSARTAVNLSVRTNGRCPSERRTHT